MFLRRFVSAPEQSASDAPFFMLLHMGKRVLFEHIKVSSQWYQRLEHVHADKNAHTIVLQEELKIAMQLLGIASLDEAHAGFLNTAALDALLPSSTTSDWNFKCNKRALKL